MSCDRVSPLLSPFLDRELDARDDEAVRVHLATCDRCAARLDTLRAMRSAVRSARPAPSDQGLEALERRLLQDRRPEPRRPAGRRALWAGLAAGLALLAAGSVWLSVDRAARETPAVSAPAPMSLSPGFSSPEAALAAPDTPCARPEDCGQRARQIWPALPI